MKNKWFSLIRRPAKPLFHYTDAKGLLGILGHGNIWATSALSLNDYEELIYAFGLMREEISIQEKSASGEAASLLKGLVKELDETEQGLNPLSSTPLKNVFVCSFCGDGDLLSQWRAYGLDGNAYSIGFNLRGQIFEDRLREGIELCPCIYTESQQRGVIQDFLKGGLDSLHGRLTKSSQPNRDFAPKERVIAMQAMDLRILFVKLASVLKHPKFEEEKEWRWFSRAYTPRANEICYREQNSTIIAYVKIKLAERNELLPIDRIYVGPTPDRNLRKEHLEDLLRAKGYSCSVETSVIPYRGGWRKT